MDRGIYTKWIISGIIFLPIVAASCYFCYEHEMAPYKQESAKAEELLRQSEKSKQVSDSSNESEQMDFGAITESKTPTAEKPIPPASDVTNNAKEDDSVLAEELAKDVPVSPFGFGPYPEVPADYFGNPVWARNPDLFSDFPDDALKNIELIDRVLIKLWQQGDRESVGGSTYNGKIYPHYDNVLYARWKEIPLPDGNVH